MYEYTLIGFTHYDEFTIDMVLLNEDRKQYSIVSRTLLGPVETSLKNKNFTLDEICNRLVYFTDMDDRLPINDYLNTYSGTITKTDIDGNELYGFKPNYKKCISIETVKKWLIDGENIENKVNRRVLEVIKHMFKPWTLEHLSPEALLIFSI